MHANDILSSCCLVPWVTPGLTTFSVTLRRLIYLFQFWGGLPFSSFFFFFSHFFSVLQQTNKQRL